MQTTISTSPAPVHYSSKPLSSSVTPRCGSLSSVPSGITFLCKNPIAFWVLFLPFSIVAAQGFWMTNIRFPSSFSMFFRISPITSFSLRSFQFWITSVPVTLSLIPALQINWTGIRAPNNFTFPSRNRFSALTNSCNWISSYFLRFPFILVLSLVLFVRFMVVSPPISLVFRAFLRVLKWHKTDYTINSKERQGECYRYEWNSLSLTGAV